MEVSSGNALGINIMGQEEIGMDGEERSRTVAKWKAYTLSKVSSDPSIADMLP